MTTNDEMARWIEILRTMPRGPQSWRHPSFADLVDTHGRFYTPAPWPLADAHRPGQCFKAATEGAHTHEWTYVEGLVLVPDAAPFEVFDHAWCLTNAGKVADPAIPNGLAVLYLGIPVTTTFRLDQQSRRGTYAVFTDDPDNPLAGVNEPVLRDGLPVDAIATAPSAGFTRDVTAYRRET